MRRSLPDSQRTQRLQHRREELPELPGAGRLRGVGVEVFALCEGLGDEEEEGVGSPGEITQFTNGFSRPNMCPQSSGGVLMEWQGSDRTLTVDIEEVAERHPRRSGSPSRSCVPASPSGKGTSRTSRTCSTRASLVTMDRFATWST